jgi:hypothetical protein
VVKRRISMISRDLDRLNVLQDLKSKQIKTSRAAKSMRVSLRFGFRLKNNFIKDGPEGLISKKVGA